MRRHARVVVIGGGVVGVGAHRCGAGALRNTVTLLEAGAEFNIGQCGMRAVDSLRIEKSYRMGGRI